MHIIKLAINKHSAQNDKILEKISSIELQIQRQRGFMAGLMAGLKSAGTATIAFGTFVIGIIAFFIDHIFGKQ